MKPRACGRYRTLPRTRNGPYVSACQPKGVHAGNIDEHIGLHRAIVVPVSIEGPANE